MPMQGFVLYGPFVGEFAWELLWWQGWVRLHSHRSRRRGLVIVACSFRGRSPFYPNADHFIAAEDFNIVGENHSSRAYIADDWDESTFLPPLRLSSGTVSLINHLGARFPGSYKVFAPWRTIKTEDICFGTGLIDHQYVHRKPSSAMQDLHPLHCRRSLGLRVGLSARGIAIFPRYRKTRRPDKNLNEQFYMSLSKLLIGLGFQVFLLGEPSGAYSFDLECNSFVNLVEGVAEDERLDAHINALSQCVYAIGGISGALFFSLYQGVSTIALGTADMLNCFGLSENIRNTPLFAVAIENGDQVVLASIEKIIIGGT